MRPPADDFQHVLRQVFLEGRILALVEDDHLDIVCLAEGEHQFRAKAQQAILVGD